MLHLGGEPWRQGREPHISCLPLFPVLALVESLITAIRNDITMASEELDKPRSQEHKSHPHLTAP